MSMHNLLELDISPKSPDHLYHPDKARPKPKPRSRSRTRSGNNDNASKENVPRPKPKPRARQNVKRDVDVDEVVSMSSISSGNLSHSAFDNPGFQNDDGNLSSQNNFRQSLVHSERYPSDESIANRYKTRTIRTKSVVQKNVHDENIGARNNSRHDKLEMSEDEEPFWEEEDDSYMYIEKESDERGAVPNKSGDSNILKSNANENKTKRRTRRNSDSDTEVTDERSKDEHLAIEIENEKAVPKNKQKPPSTSLWQRFLSKGPSRQQIPEKSSTEQTLESKRNIKAETHGDQMSNSGTDSVKSYDNEIKVRKNIENVTQKQGVDTSSFRMREKLRNFKETSKKKIQSLKVEEFNMKPKRKSSKDEEKSIESNDSSSETDQDLKESRIKKKNTLLHHVPSSPKQSRRTLSSLNSLDRDQLLGVTIHGCDVLPLNPNILHPIVKLSLLTEDGKAISKSQHRRKTKINKSKRLVEELQPIMTQPFKLEFNLNSFAPKWDELLLFEEPFNSFLIQNPDAIMFFEIVDFLSMEKVNEIKASGSNDPDVGWYQLAWAFLKPVSSHGFLNVDRKLRLQLYKPVNLKKKEILDGPKVFSWWKSGRMKKLVNTTLYVTVKGIIPPPPTNNNNLKQLLTMRKENLSEAILEGKMNSDENDRKRKKQRRQGTQIDVRKVVNWNRLEGQSCKAPNRLLKDLPYQPNVEDINLTISGNVHCLKFSPCGLKLAAGLNTYDDLHAILLFEIPSGKLIRSLKQHHGLIYDISWNEVDIDESNYFQYISSASADSTACVWKMKNNQHNSLKHIKTLHHPSFVYCVKFHPSQPSLLVTGCFDFIIRIWDINDSTKGEDNTYSKLYTHDSSPLFILDRHCSFVNCLLFNENGTNLFSGDGDSLLIKWHIKSSLKRKSWTVEKETKVSDTERIPINSLSLHPNGIRLLVHLRDNCFKILDSTSFIHLKTIRGGVVNEMFQIRSCFSPCGNLIISGSEKPTICIWDADTYEMSNLLSPKNHKNCYVTSVDYHPFDFYLAVGIASAVGEPNPILLYIYDAPKLSSIAVVQTGVAKFKANLLRSQESKRKVSFAQKRGDSSEKFMSIIGKLDKALKDAQDPKRMRHRNSEHLQRSISVDVPDVRNSVDDSIPSRPSSAQGNFASIEGIEREYRDSGETVYRSSRQKYKSKSPRTYIENRLEELIMSSPKRQRERDERDPSKPTSSRKNSKQEDIDAMNLEDEKLLKNLRNTNDTSSRRNSKEVETLLSPKLLHQHSEEPDVVQPPKESPMNTEILSPKNLPIPTRRQRSKIPITISERPTQKMGDHKLIPTSTPPKSPERDNAPLQIADASEHLDN